MSEIKITFIITRADDLGGAQVHLRELAAALTKRGEDLTVLAGGGGILFEQLTVRGVSCRKLRYLVHPIRPCSDILACLEIFRFLKEERPNLVATHSNKAGLLGRFAARSLGIPVVHTSHGFLFSGRPHSVAGRFYRLFEMIASQLSSRVICVSKSDYEEARRFKVVVKEKLALIHNGLPDKDNLPQANPAKKPVKMIMIARFEEPKDHDTLLEALGKLKQLPWTLQLVGEGKGWKKTKKKAAVLGLTEKVEFAGMQDNPEELLAESQIFILSSRREGFPISILEAMRAGLPIIASRVGGVEEAVLDGTTGFLFEAGDAMALCDIIEDLLKSAKQRRSLGKAGRNRFIEYFKIDMMVERTLELYRQIYAECANEWNNNV